MHRHATTGIENDPFGAQFLVLALGAAMLRDSSAGTNDPVPGQVVPRGQLPHGRPDQARRGAFGHPGDPAVGGDSPCGYLRHDGVDLFQELGTNGHR